ncbi:MAG: hypothetical protein EVA89_12615 [Sandaracinaceae bacterium]|nr:MAG: hypothetical protein EVA89_12615 [Sandaracinaceae bacterium]
MTFAENETKRSVDRDDLSLATRWMRRSHAVVMSLVLVTFGGCDASPTVDDAGADAGRLGDAGDGPTDSGTELVPDADTDGGVPFTVTIIEPGSPLIGSEGEVTLRVFVDGAAPELVNLRLDGEPLASIPAPFEYALNLGELAEGTHEVVAAAMAEDASVVSEPLEILVDRTGPTVVRVEPPTAELYRLGSPVTVTFDEAIDEMSVAAPSTGLVTDRGAVLTVALDLDSTRTVLTITPSGPDMVADATVDLTLGVSDPSGNSVAPFEAVWTSPRWLPVGGELFRRRPGESFAEEHLEVRREATGEILVAALVATGSGTHHVRVSRFDGTTWSELGDGACESAGILPPFTDPLGSWDIALEPDGTPVVAVRDISDLSAAVARFCRFDGARWQLETEEVLPFNLREISFAISPSGDRVLGVSTQDTSDDRYRRPRTWRKDVGGAWTRLGSSFGPSHERQYLFEVEFDRLARLNELHTDTFSRHLTHRDTFNNVVRDAQAEGRWTRARLAETSSSRAMLGGCVLVEAGTPAPLISLDSHQQCDVVVHPTSERRFLVYTNRSELGAALETTGTFEDLGSTPLHMGPSGGTCFPPVDGCRFQVEASFTTVGPTGRILAIVHSGFDIRSFELHTLGTVL